MRTPSTSLEERESRGSGAMSRAWAMPSGNTFTVRPIRDFVLRYLHGVSVDPFARDSRLATLTNDIDPATAADDHELADEWLNGLANRGVVADVVIFDPPYSPRQISDCYKGAGRLVTQSTTQSAALYARCRKEIRRLIRPGGIVLSFGWNSVGMGIAGFERIETLLVSHGGAHNDTICVADRCIASPSTTL